MKKLVLIAGLLLSSLAFSQAPEKMSYQAVVRNATGQLLQNQNVGIKASILQNSATGTVVYSETLMETTNANGLMSLAIGSGTVLSGAFASIDWSTGNYYLKTETDPSGGTNYTIAGTSQLLSVPYAMYAKASGSGSGSGWSLAGNNVTVNDFIGTINDIPLKFKIHDVYSGYIGKSNTAFGYDSLKENAEGGANTAFGPSSLSQNTTGSANSAFGQYSMRYNTTGESNTAIGRGAMYTNESGNRNVANGFGAMFYNKSGNDNVAIGYRSLFSNVEGTYNIATGSESLRSNTSGSNNIAMGTNALYANTTGIQNIAIGANSLTANIAGNYNVATGTEALQNNIGNDNVAIGHRALSLNTSGISNAANGRDALYSNTTGSFNVANGMGALYTNFSGGWNVAVGSAALYSNISGNNNIATGNQAMQAKISGDNNIAIGNQALFKNREASDNIAIGYQSLSNDQTGSDNVAIGYQSLSTSTYGILNTAIGNYTDILEEYFRNATAIGYQAKVSTSNKIRLGNTNVTVIEGQVPFSNVSDERFKYDIKNNVPGLDFIKKLKPVTYYMDNEKMDNFLKTGTISSAKATTSTNQQMSTGFLAQEVAKTAQELGYSFDGVHAPTNEKDYYSIAYSQFVMPLVKAVQEQQAMIETLEKRIKELEKK